MDDVMVNRLSVYAAAEKYGIPKETLRVHVKNTDLKKPGHPCVLSPAEESVGVETCKVIFRMGLWVNETRSDECSAGGII